jgi:hypothetical protein
VARAFRSRPGNTAPMSTPPIAPPAPPFTARFLKNALIGLALTTAALWLASRFLLSANFLPHWYCLAGNQRLLWTTVLADLGIGVSYVFISGTLAWLVRRSGRDLPYSSFFWAFGVFIVSCGATHFLEVATVWYPIYWLAALVKVITALGFDRNRSSAPLRRRRYRGICQDRARCGGPPRQRKIPHFSGSRSHRRGGL